MKRRSPVTPAVRVLRDAGIEYTEHLYDYDRHPGAQGAADSIGVDVALTAKTVVFATSEGSGVVVVMNGDREVSTKTLARLLGVKSARPATQDEGTRWTGYRFGGTSPLGMRTAIPVWAQTDIGNQDITYVNAGARGFVIGMNPTQLIELTGAKLANLAAE